MTSTLLDDITAVAVAADPTVTGCAIVKESREGWHVVTISTGERVRVDSLTGARPTAAIVALASTDFGDMARRRRETAARARQAIRQLMTATDDTSVAVRGALSYSFTLQNDLRAYLGLPRMTEQQIYAGIVSFLASGAGEPTPQPLAPIGG